MGHPVTVRSMQFARLPEALRRALVEALGPEVERVDLIENSWRVRWHPRALATTRLGRIYLRCSIEEFARDTELVLHEYFHVLEQWQTRRLTRYRYLRELLRRGYRHNRFEVEAREFVEKNLRKFRVLIARAGEPLTPALSPQAGRGSGPSPQPSPASGSASGALTPTRSPEGRGSGPSPQPSPGSGRGREA